MDTQLLVNEFRQAVDDAVLKFGAISEEESGVPLGPEKWSRKELLGHLIDSAANNHQRFIRGQLVHSYSGPGYDQEGWVERNGYSTRQWADLVNLWRAYNLHLQHVMTNMLPETLDTPCII